MTKPLCVCSIIDCETGVDSMLYCCVIHGISDVGIKPGVEDESFYVLAEVSRLRHGTFVYVCTFV